jgi:hypothetical protein
MIVQPVSRQRARAALAVITLSLLQASGTVSAAAIIVPDNLQPAASTTLALEAHAVGVQIYTCDAAKTEGTAPAWTLKAPDAILSDASGAKVAKHYAGPTWEAPDGSKVIGKAKASATPSPDAIPWLLLDVKSTSGNGIFSKITAVQRVATEAGKAPQDGCSVASVGQEVRVPYQAVYRFYTNN